METEQGCEVKRLLWLPGLVLLLAGCSAPTIYSWGHYEDLIHVTYKAPGKVPPELAVEKLEEDFQKARSKNKPVPPGWHAHLGCLYFELGKLDQAQQEFQTEKANFPESAVFMDRFLAKFKQQ
jgi:hypothetical protein